MNNVPSLEAKNSELTPVEEMFDSVPDDGDGEEQAVDTCSREYYGRECQHPDVHE